MRTTLHTRTPARVAATASAAVAALTMLAACGDPAGADATSSAASSSETSSAAAGDTDETSALTVTDGWAKATTEKMTGAFGTLKNTTDEPIVITGGTSPVAGMVEAHVMEKGDDGQMVMTEAKDGFTIEPGDTMELKPGAEHLMLMKLTEPLKAGDEVEITVTTKGGEEYPLTFSVREFTGADEEYEPESGHSGSSH